VSAVGFERLHPSLQHHVVNSLGWSELRPLQAEAIDPILDGMHSLLLAPTAGGKTEAAVFPVLSRIATERLAPLSTLYLCPLRALLNDLHPRLERYAAYTGHRVGLWHGDIGPSPRRRLIAEPPDILLTTPESLEAMLMSTRVDGASLSANVRTAIVDEVHAFAGDDRGWHLLAVLARIERLAGRTLQRIGLSATVGNPEALLAWLTPGRDGTRSVVAPAAGPRTPPEVMIDHVGTLDNAATVIAGLHHGEKRLVFVDSRKRAEELTHALRVLDVTTHVTHASLGRDERHQAEQAFAESSNCVIVATSALELGIDVGDLDRVIQIDAPGSVASVLQRLGRSGRRAAAASNTLFLTTREDSLWLACGLTRLWREGYVEPITPPPLPAHLLAHQLLALALQEGAVGANTWTEWLGDPMVFGPDVALLDDAVSEHLTANAYLHVDGGMLSIGREAEARFGRRHFLELTSVFTSPPMFTVLAGRREIGYAHDLGIAAAFQVRQGPPVLLLGGRGWRILEVDWRRHRVHVELTELKGRTRYHGGSSLLGRELTRSLGAVLAGDDPGVPLSGRATAVLDESRSSFPGLRADDGTYLRRSPTGKAEWWTFAGMRANLELSARLGKLHRPGSLDNLVIPLIDDTTTADVRQALDVTTPVDDLLDLAEEATAGIKFADCIPGWLADSIMLARLTDHASVEAATTAPIVEGFIA
jgi:ATP-dependent Lhr-like helicase